VQQIVAEGNTDVKDDDNPIAAGLPNVGSAGTIQ
jgi:hypothetical protein